MESGESANGSASGSSVDKTVQQACDNQDLNATLNCDGPPYEILFYPKPNPELVDQVMTHTSNLEVPQELYTGDGDPTRDLQMGEGEGEGDFYIHLDMVELHPEVFTFFVNKVGLRDLIRNTLFWPPPPQKPKGLRAESKYTAQTLLFDFFCGSIKMSLELFAHHGIVVSPITLGGLMKHVHEVVLYRTQRRASDRIMWLKRLLYVKNQVKEHYIYIHTIMQEQTIIQNTLLKEQAQYMVLNNSLLSSNQESFLFRSYFNISDLKWICKKTSEKSLPLCGFVQRLMLQYKILKTLSYWDTIVPIYTQLEKQRANKSAKVCTTSLLKSVYTDSGSFNAANVRFNQNYQPLEGLLEADSSEFQLSDVMTVSLNCPISLKRIQIPVKFIGCQHVECFCFNSYSSFNEHIRNTQPCPKPCPIPCPICKAPYSTLVVPRVMESALEAATKEDSAVRINLRTSKIEGFVNSKVLGKRKVETYTIDLDDC